MSVFDNSQAHEIELPMDFDSAFSLVLKAASVCGKITDENRFIGLISYTTKMSVLSLKNASKVNINLSKREGSTLLRLTVDSVDGSGLLRSSSRTYDDFVSELSKQSKQ